MPTREQSEKAYAEVEERRERYKRPDRHRPCRARLSRQISQSLHERLGPLSFNVTPQGKVLPCHAAETIPGLEFWNAREKKLADIWAQFARASTPFAAMNGCRSPAAPASARPWISAAAAARLWRWSATPRPATRSASKSPHHDLIRRNRRARFSRNRRGLHAPPSRKDTREGQGLNTNFSLGAQFCRVWLRGKKQVAPHFLQGRQSTIPLRPPALRSCKILEDNRGVKHPQTRAFPSCLLCPWSAPSALWRMAT